MATAIGAKHTTRKPRVKLAPSGPRGCDHCELRSCWTQLSTPRMPISMPANPQAKPDILVIGEAPGEQEDRRGVAMIGKTGSFLREQLPARLDDRLAFTNIARCRPPENRTPTPHEMYACSMHLENDLEQLSIKAILGVGTPALSALVDPALSIMRVHGLRTPIRIGNHVLWYYPIFHPSYVMRLRDNNSFGEGVAYPVWSTDIQHFLHDVDTWPKPAIADISVDKVIVPGERAEAEQLVQRMRGPIAVDLETHLLRPYLLDAKLLTAAFSDGETTIAFSVDHPRSRNPWGLEFLLSTLEQRHWVAHNAAFELAWLLYYSAQAGRDHDLAMFEDTQAIGRLLHQRVGVNDLASMSRIHLGVNVKQLAPVNVTDLLNTPIEQVLQYNGLDAMATALLYHLLRRRVKRDDYERMLRRTDSFVMMQLYGLDTDAKAIEVLLNGEDGRSGLLGQRRDAAHRAANVYEAKQFATEHGEFNIGSPEQVGKALADYAHIALPKTKRAYKTDEATLSTIAPDHPLVRAVLDWRETDKLIGTYVEPFRDLPKRTTDGRIHPCYSPLLVSTYRSQSDDPNIQNVPKRKHREIRRAIVAPPGHVLAALDQGQLQVRILAMASKDRRLIANIMNGVDTHSQWLNNLLVIYPSYLARLADMTGETDEAKVRKAGRDIIKGDFVFNSFFGGGVTNIARRTHVPEPIIANLQGAFWEEFSGVRKWQTARRREYVDTGAVTGLSGLVRRGVMMGNEPINCGIQCGEADIVLDAQADLSRMSVHSGDIYLHPRINIHDDLTFVLPNDDRLAGYIKRIAEVMTRVRFNWQIVPLVVEAKIGPNWADLNNYREYTGDYVR